MDHILTIILTFFVIFANAQNSDDPSNPFSESKCGDTFTRVCKNLKYRTMDGSCNNKLQPTWGMSFTRFGRLVPANYADGYYAPRLAKSGETLPLARDLSRVLSPDKKIIDKKYTALVMQWAQVAAHDIILSDFRKSTSENNCCSEKGKLIRDPAKYPLCYPVLVPKDDPDYGKSGIECFNLFVRSNTDVARGCAPRDGVQNQLALTTSYFDLSLVYGSTDKEAASLREFRGGRLLADVRKNQEWPPHSDTCAKEAEVCYRTGDVRTNQGIQLAIFVVALFRQHNLMAGKLAKLNPHWNDERLYQETRRIYIAISQHITYNELLPIILGVENSYREKITYNTANYVNDYNLSVDVSTLVEVVSAVMRSFHTLLSANFNMVNENRDPPHGKANVNNLFNNPTIIEKGDNYDCLMRGLASQPQEGADQYYDKMFTVDLFLGVTKVKTDGRAVDIQRGRDYGLGTYNKYREFCGFPRAVKWEDFLDFIPLDDVIDMITLYDSPDDVDLTVGGSLEKLVPGSLVGPTFQCILNIQFYRARVGDRFFFENGNSGHPFTLDQLNEIRKFSISRMICDNTDTKSIQRRGFEQISKVNPLVSCQSIPNIDLSLWKECDPSNPFSESKCGDSFNRECKKSKYRTADGSCNNKLHPTWGMTFTRYARLVPANYNDGYYSPRRSKSGKTLPLARILSYVFSPDKKIVDKKYSSLATQWTQILTHDIVLSDNRENTTDTNCCSDNGKLVRNPAKYPLCYPALLPKDDVDFGWSGIECFNSFIRKHTDVDRGCGPRDGVHNQLVITTHFLDLSGVYGSTDKEAASLREFNGGRLLTETRKNKKWPPKENTCLQSAKVCYKTGDQRANLGVSLAFFSVILVREHNRIANELSQLNHHWDDEKLYQETRRIFIAVEQHISYYEWIPIFLGVKHSQFYRLIYNTTGYVNDYDPSINPSSINEGVASVLRSFHTLLSGELSLMNENRDPPYASANINDNFNNPSLIEINDNYNSLIRGLATQHQEAYDQYYNEEMTVYVNLGPGIVRSDSRALDIHRGRDHGLGTYNQYRKYCGFPEAKNWEDFLDFISIENVKDLKSTYESPDDVDLSVGASLERSELGSLIGPTFKCILTAELYRKRVGDRFFYENGKSGFPFTLEQLNEIRKATVSRLLCDNSDIQSIQRRGMEVISKKNPLVGCKSIPKIDLSLWKE
ncbi:peroxidase-like [Leptopilina boulardi]|uniref:peroxidase-like n=1 Tax=Leptopilina boulardi TaxID=63433 RepID=UPI0021F65FA8|nr:peroxidase-like [Leptopilina boulardi]